MAKNLLKEMMAAYGRAEELDKKVCCEFPAPGALPKVGARPLRCSVNDDGDSLVLERYAGELVLEYKEVIWFRDHLNRITGKE